MDTTKQNNKWNEIQLLSHQKFVVSPRIQFFLCDVEILQFNFQVWESFEVLHRNQARLTLERFQGVVNDHMLPTQRTQSSFSKSSTADIWDFSNIFYKIPAGFASKQVQTSSFTAAKFEIHHWYFHCRTRRNLSSEAELFLIKPHLFGRFSCCSRIQCPNLFRRLESICPDNVFLIFWHVWKKKNGWGRITLFWSINTFALAELEKYLQEKTQERIETSQPGSS